MRKLPIEEVEQRHPDFIVGQTWFGADNYYKYRCKTHGIYLQHFEVHNDGSGCPKCGREKCDVSRRLSVNEIEKRFSDIVLGQSWASDRKYYFICEIHGIYLQDYHSHEAGRRCPKCRSRKIVESKLYTIKGVEKQFPDLKRGQI